MWREAKNSPAGKLAPSSPGDSGWSFSSSHAQVLVCLVEDPQSRLKDLAARVGVTERSVQRILTDLERAGLLERHRKGRRNSYSLMLDRSARHPLESHRTVNELVRFFARNPRAL